MPALQSTFVPGLDLTVLWNRNAPNPWLLPPLAKGGLQHWVVANVVVAALYAGLGAVVGQFFSAYGLFPAPIWLPAGLACVASMVGGAALLPGIFIGSFAVNWLLFHSPLLIAVMISCTNAVGPWAGANLTRCFRPPSGLFTRFLGVFGFIVGAVGLHAAITAAGGMIALMADHAMTSAQAYRVFASWWLCDSGGTFFFAPALLLWLGAERTPRILEKPPTRIDALVLLGTVATAVLLFAVPDVGRLVRPDAVFLLTVPLSWITLRISLRAAYTLLTLICITATVGTVTGQGPFHAVSVANPLQSVGLMTVLFAMDALTLIALTSERRDAEARLAETRGALAQASARTETLQRESLTDPLTGIGNRRFFMRTGRHAVERARLTCRAFSLILLDLDHFKQLNDTNGHAAGDAALQTVAQTLGGMIRGEDILARIGGEEFAIGLPDTAAAEAMEVAERLRRSIGRLTPAAPDGTVMTLTASFGITAMLRGDRRLEELLQRADEAVYAAKANGRDRVEFVAGG